MWNSMLSARLSVDWILSRLSSMFIKEIIKQSRWLGNKSKKRIADMHRLQTDSRMTRACTLRLNYCITKKTQKVLSSIDSRSSTAEKRLEASISMKSCTKTSKNSVNNEVTRTSIYTITLLAISKAEESWFPKNIDTRHPTTICNLMIWTTSLITTESSKLLGIKETALRGRLISLMALMWLITGWEIAKWYMTREKRGSKILN